MSLYKPSLAHYQISEYYTKEDKNPCIVALGEMAGFPNPITGKITTYTDFLKQELDLPLYPNKGLFTQVYDFQSLFFQKSYFIESLLRNNPTISEIDCLLGNSVTTTKEQSLCNHMLVRNRLKKRYQNDEMNTIHNVLKTNHGTIILRSSLSNDLSYKIQENVFSVLGKKGKRHAALEIEENKEELIQEIIEDISRNYQLLYTLDPNACIVEIGIRIPKLFLLQKENPNMKIIIHFLLDLIEELRLITKKQDVAYINGESVEESSLWKGQQKLCYEIMKVLAEKLPNKVNHSASNEAIFTYQGLEGMMQEEDMLAKKYAELYYQTKEEMYYHLVQEHMLASSCYQKTLYEKNTIM